MRVRRYDRGIPPEEINGRIVPAAIDVFGLGVLVDELLSNKEDGDLPSLSEMVNFCRLRMLEPNPRNRAALTEVGAHPFFSHDFIRIHRFLAELPLKTPEEKLEFFRELEQQLTSLPEKMVASQLLSLLLARIVVLDSAAQNHLLPSLLTPKTGARIDGAMFSENVFKEFVVPKLLHMFQVRDTSVRLLLLTHLSGFVGAFTSEQLRCQLLPELLLGVKDVDDELVAATLHSLAVLVGTLGGSAVVGGKRAKLFSDGRPARRKPRRSPTLLERPSPDGGEDSAADDSMAWSDWEQPSEKEPDTISTPLVESPVKTVPEPKPPPLSQPKPTIKAALTLADLDALDVKSSSGWRAGTEDDFFRDMEPVIRKTEVMQVSNETNKFQVSEVAAVGEEWDTFEEWGT